MPTDKVIKVITIPTRTGDTVASYNAYSSVDGLLGVMTPAEAVAGKTFALSDGASHNVTVKAVWTTAGESTTNVSNIEVVDLSFLLDLYPAAAAYSLRKLKNTATYGIKIRRADNSVTDVILEDTGEITKSSIVVAGGSLDAWIGAGGDAYIQTWYDQSGNGEHIIQTDIALQGALVLGGVLQTSNGKSAIKIPDGSYLANSTFAFDTSTFSLIEVVKKNTLATNKSSTFGLGDQTEAFKYLVSLGWLAGTDRAIFVGDGTSNEAALLSAGLVSLSQNLQTTIRDSSQHLWLYDNGVASSNASKALTVNAVGLYIPAYLYNPSENLYQETILFPNDISVNRAAIESNINAFYTIY